MEETFVAIMIIGHGGIITTRNDLNMSEPRLSLGLPGMRSRKNHSSSNKIRWAHEEYRRRMLPREMSIMPEIINTNSNISLCTFAVPTESCFYEDNTLIALKYDLLDRVGNLSEINDDIFKNVLYVGQRRGKEPYTYSSKDWAPYFTKRPQYTERWVHGKKHINKIYKDAPESPVNCGIFMLQNNVGIKNGSLITHPEDGMTLKEIVEYFEEDYGVNKLYILDVTCSVVYNPEMDDYIRDPNILDNIFKHGVSLMTAGKIKNKSKRNKFKKNKFKRNKSKRNRKK